MPPLEENNVAVSALFELTQNLTYDDICSLLSISKRTLYRWMEVHKVPRPGRGCRSKTSSFREAVSQKLRGRVRPDTVRKKISAGLTGRKLSEETKRKISIARRKKGGS